MFFRDLGQGPFLHTIDITGRNELQGSDARLRLRPGLVAASVLRLGCLEAWRRYSRTACAQARVRHQMTLIHRLLTIKKSFAGSANFNGTGQGLIKVDGTFV